MSDLIYEKIGTNLAYCQLETEAIKKSIENGEFEFTEGGSATYQFSYEYQDNLYEYEMEEEEEWDFFKKEIRDLIHIIYWLDIEILHAIF